MQTILVRKYPLLLIDESQDTQKDLIDAFFKVQKEHSEEFCLCLFGDTMQRIYADGKVGLEGAVPDDWEKLEITINFRSPKRIIRLINTIRSHVDTHEQEPTDGASEGFVRLFLVSNDGHADKAIVETKITKQMAEITSDDKWSEEHSGVKMLTLEHHMAARRGGFNDFFEPLYRIPKFKTGLLDGTLSGIPFFLQQILPLIESLQSGNRFAVAQIVKRYSPMVRHDTLKGSKSPLEDLRTADKAVQSLFALLDSDSDPLLTDLLNEVAKSGLFTIPDVFAPIVSRGDSSEDNEASEDPEDTSDNDPIDAWDAALSTPFCQLQSYEKYISDRSPFGTHQGIKGLQFPRVMVILDDNEARGFMFSYDKLLGAKIPSSTDNINAEEGKETSIDRTRRLFYVTCSRAQNSLAVVVYTEEPDKIRTYVLDQSWFTEDEIIIL